MAPGTQSFPDKADVGLTLDRSASVMANADSVAGAVPDVRSSARTLVTSTEGERATNTCAIYNNN